MSKLHVAALLAALAVPAVARADALDVAKAEGLFNQGVKLLEQKNYAEACRMLEESRKLASGIGVTLYLADCYEQEGKLSAALQLFKNAEDMAAQKKDARQAIAHERAAKLDALVPRIALRVAPEVVLAKQQVTLDGRKIDPTEYGQPLAVDPGNHQIVATREDGTNQWRSDVTAASGASVSLDVPLVPPGAAASAPAAAPTALPAATPPRAPEQVEHAPPAADPGKTQRTVGIAIGAAGIVGLAAGAVLGFAAQSKLNDSNASNHCDANDKCDPTGLGLRQDAYGSATASTVFFVLGGVAIAGGAALYFTAPKAGASRAAFSIAPALGPRGGGLAARGSF